MEDSTFAEPYRYYVISHLGIEAPSSNGAQVKKVSKQDLSCRVMLPEAVFSTTVKLSVLHDGLSRSVPVPCCSLPLAARETRLAFMLVFPRFGSV